MYRWLAAFVLLGAVGVSAFHRHRARQHGETIPRGREGPWLILGRLALGLPLFLSVVLCIVHPSWTAWASFEAPHALRLAGVALGLLVIPLVWWILATLGPNVSETVLTKRDHTLVTSGPYRWVRHPLYAAGIGLFVALGLMAANALILILAAVALLGIRFVVIPREEAALTEKFGGAYRAYMAQSHRLLPLPRPGAPSRSGSAT